MTYGLEVKNLNKTFPDFSLEDISFKLPKGSIMGLIGANGAGKTTLIKSLLDIVKKDSGQVYFLGQEFKPEDLSLKEELAVVLDGDFFQEDLSPQELNRIFKGLYKNWQEGVFYSYLDKFKLPLDSQVKTFSKGMKTKLAIAAALSHGAKLLILDEPTSGLDPITRMEILDEFLNFIQDDQCSILFSSHITSDLDKIADYISLIQDGRLVFSKDREELLSDYAIVRCSKDSLAKIKKESILRLIRGDFNLSVLVKNREGLDPDLLVDRPTTEELLLFFTRGETI